MERKNLPLPYVTTRMTFADKTAWHAVRRVDRGIVPTHPNNRVESKKSNLPEQADILQPPTLEELHEELYSLKRRRSISEIDRETFITLKGKILLEIDNLEGGE